MNEKLQQEKIRKLRRRILEKMFITLPIILILFSLFGLLMIDQAPEDWTSTEIVFSHFSREHTGIHRGDDDVLNTQDGRKFDLRTNDVSLEMLQKDLIPGESYRITYSERFLDVPTMEALESADTVYQSLDDSVEWWNQEQRKVYACILFTVAAEVIALILVDKLWCKKEHMEIKKRKQSLVNNGIQPQRGRKR